MASRRDAIGLVSGQDLMGPLLGMGIPPDIRLTGRVTGSCVYPARQAFQPLDRQKDTGSLSAAFRKPLLPLCLVSVDGSCQRDLQREVLCLAVRTELPGEGCAGTASSVVLAKLEPPVPKVTGQQGSCGRPESRVWPGALVRGGTWRVATGVGRRVFLPTVNLFPFTEQ